MTTDVRLTQVPVTVLDDKGAPVTNINKSNFRIVEDGVEQQALYLDKEREPVSFVIVADMSQSMTNKIPFVREAALSILDPQHAIDRIPDEFALFGFESRVTRLVSFSLDQQDLESRIPLLVNPTEGSTALFDALYEGAAEARERGRNHRRALIVITDGGDNHSRYNFRETKKFLEEADVSIFAVMAGPLFELSDLLPLPEKKPHANNLPLPTPAKDFVGPNERQGPRILKRLTEVTGGSVFTAHDLNDLPRIVQTIALAVRFQYLLSYQSSGPSVKQSKWHRIHIELDPQERFRRYSLFYKQGYFSGPE